MKWLGEGSGTTYELVIQTPPPRGVAPMPTRSARGVLSVKSMLQHVDAVRAATTLSVELFDVYVTLLLEPYPVITGHMRRVHGP